MTAGVFVRLSEVEIARLDEIRRGESRPAALRRLLRDFSGDSAGSGAPSAHEALELLAAQARDGKTAAVVAYARIFADTEVDITALRVRARRDELAVARQRREAGQ